MGGVKPNNEENPLASTSPLKNDEFELTERQNEAAECTGDFHYGNGAETEPLSFPYKPLPVAPLTWKNIPGTHQSCADNITETGGNLMVDLSLNNLQNPQIDPDSMNIRSNIPNLNRPETDFPCCEGNTKGVWSSYTQDNIVTADNVIRSAALLNNFQNPQANRNFMQSRGNAAGGFQMVSQSEEANSSNIHGPQTNTNSVGLGGRTPMLYHIQSSGEVGIDNSVCSPENFDGTFLTLGIGGKMEARSKYDHNSRQNTNKSDEVGSSRLNASNFQHATRSSSNIVQNLAAGFSTMHDNNNNSNSNNNAGGFSSMVQNVSGWTASNNDVGVLHGTTGLTSSPFHVLPQPTVEMQHYFPMPIPSNRKLGLVGNRDPRYANSGPYRGFVDHLGLSSGPFCNSSTGLIDDGPTGLSGLTSEFAKFTQITPQPTSDQLRICQMKPVQNFSPESSKGSQFVRIKGSSTRQDHSAKLSPVPEAGATQAAESNQFIRRVGLQPAGKLHSAHDGSAAQAARGCPFPQRIGVQIPKGSAAQIAEGGLFPNRIGIQVAEGCAVQDAKCRLYPKGIGVQTASKLGQPQGNLPAQFPINFAQPTFTDGRPQGNLPVQFPRNFAQPAFTDGRPQGNLPVQFPRNFAQPAFTDGRPQGNLPVQFPRNFAQPAFTDGRSQQRVPFQFPIDLYGPSLSNGRSQEGVPFHFAKDLLGPTSTTGQVNPIAKGSVLSQAYNFPRGPSTKRSAIRPPPAAPQVQRRKIVTRPSAPPSVPSLHAPAPIPTPSAAPTPTAAAPPRIKWQGSGGPPQPSGQKCPLCKRDLSFTPEGPLYQPTVPPVVAVLPCSHTFHAHCLEIITPADQAKSPPCIPCAVGEF